MGKTKSTQRFIFTGKIKNLICNLLFFPAFTVIIFLLFFIITGCSMEYESEYGGGGAEEMETIVKVSETTFIVAGGSESFSDNEKADALLVKMTIDGNIEWAKIYGGSQDDMLIDVKLAKDGGLWAVGWTKSFGVEGTDFWVLRLDDQGEVIWAKAYGGKGTEQAWSVTTMADGGIAVAGGTNSFGAGKADLWLVRLDADGNIVWQNTYGGAGDDAGGGDYEEYVARVVTSKDGNLVAGTTTTSFGTGGDLWLLKIDDNNPGSILWQYSYGAEDEDSTWSFSALDDGGFLMTGSYAYTNPQWDADAWAVRLKADGTIQWQKTYGLEGKFDEVLSEEPTSDGGAILASYYEETDLDWRASLIKVDSNGNLKWAQEYHPGALDWTNDVVEVQDGYLAMGVSTVDLVEYASVLMIWQVNKDGSLPDCQGVASLSLNVKDTNISPVVTNATVNQTSATVRDTDINAQEVVLDNLVLCGL